MRIEAHSVEELIDKSGEKRAGILLIDKLIYEVAPHMERWLMKEETYVMIGYGRLKYDSNFPLIAVAPQKNYISFYVTGEKEGQLFTTHYKNKLGKVSTGKSCIRIRNIQEIDHSELKNLVLDCIAWNDGEKQN